MASITQTIPNYINGISEQPDELKTPGQVTIAKNVLPDVTQGLTKRPGGKLIGDDLGAYTTDSKWFHYYRDENEQYIGQIQGSDGQIKMWRCSDGQSMTVTNDLTTTTKIGNYTRDTSGVITVNITAHGYKLGETIYLDFDSGATDAVYKITDRVDADNFKVEDGIKDNAITSTTVTSKSNYLIHLDDADIQTLTLNDYTYITNRNKPVAMDTVNKAPVRPPEAFVQLKKVAYASQYAVNLYDDDTVQTVKTVTRIRVERILDSHNSCSASTISEAQGKQQTGYADYIASAGQTEQSLTYIDSNGQEQTADFTFNARCTNQADIVTAPNGRQTDPDDALCPSVGTKVFTITGGEDETDMGATVSFTIKNTGGTAYSGSDITDRKNLSFRITTTGQSVADYVSNSDTAYKARYTTTHDLLHGGQGWEEGDNFDIFFHFAMYRIVVEEVSTSKVNANRGLIRPIPTSFDAQTTVTAESILGSIKTEIDNYANSNFNTDAEDANGNPITDGSTNAAITAAGGSYTSGVTQIGNGLYITRPAGEFNISTPVSDLLNVLTKEVKDVADLPQQCKHGYIVKVANSEAEEDDYYVKFIGRLKTGGDENDDDDYLDGPGVWEECPKPGVEIKYDPATMPIQIVRESNGTFTVKQNTWQEALVGDTAVGGTNPRASFVGKTINKMLLFRNRLVILSDENVIMSQPGEFFNFWAKSAVTYTATDMIDLSCSSEYPAIIYDGIQVNSGLVLFTKNQQFMLTTDSDVLNPITAKINALASYNFNYNTNPVSLGTTLAFLDNAGKYTRFWEMAAVLREGEPNVLEQSKSISKSFDSDLNMIANSRENQVIFFGKKSTKTLYGFRYHTAATQRIQQAWFTWELSGEIQHIAMLDDALFAIIKDGTKYTMQRFSIRGLDNSIYVDDDQGTTDTADDISYRVHLDNALVITNSQLGYSSSTTRTGFTLPDSFNASSSNKLAVFCHTVGDNNGKYAEATIVGTGSDANIEFLGNWIGQDITVGYLYDMEVQFPKIYVQQQADNQIKSDLHSSLVIHRIKFSFGPQGYYTTTLTRLGKPSFIQTHETPKLDSYTTDDVAVDPVSIHTVPAYEKNTNLTVNLKSTHPTPATLYSMTWEGDYTPKYYKSV